MVWSLSKDDDGLESVLPLTNHGEGPTSSGDRLPSPASHQAPRFPHSVPRPPSPQSTAPSPASAAPSVFVEPSSQFPDVSPRPRLREVVEPTMVLQGRQVDRLRAEVARQKSTYRREKQKTLLIWALAGGAALALGWCVGIILSPQNSAATPPGAPLSPDSYAASEPTDSQAGAAPSPKDSVRTKESPSDERGAAAHATDSSLPSRSALPSDSGVPADSDVRGDADNDAPTDSEAFTLDDLPVE